MDPSEPARPHPEQPKHTPCYCTSQSGNVPPGKLTERSNSPFISRNSTTPLLVFRQRKSAMPLPSKSDGAASSVEPNLPNVAVTITSPLRITVHVETSPCRSFFITCPAAKNPDRSGKVGGWSTMSCVNGIGPNFIIRQEITQGEVRTTAGHRIAILGRH